MSLLSQQLSKIKETQRTLKVGVQQQPTLLLDTNTASNASHDLFYTLAIISYSKMLSAQPLLKEEGDIVMAEENREINRNTLTKDLNRNLSEKLIKFLLKLSPYFLTQDCQRVIEYLLHNFKINVFESEALAIIYLQYWNNPIYTKLIDNIPEKILLQKLSFLSKIKTEVINITFIVKSLTYSHFLISSVLLYTLQYMKYEQQSVSQTMDIEINLGEEITDQLDKKQNLIKCDPRRFVLQIFSEFLNRKLTSCYKYIIQFCGKAVQLKNTSYESLSMVMLLSTRMILEDAISDDLLSNIHLKLIKKISLFNDKTLRSLFDFTLIVWQRRPSCIKKETLYYLQDFEAFIEYLSKFKCSLWMILIRLIELYLEGSQCEKLINCIGAKLKRDQFYQLYGDEYHKKLFKLIEAAFTMENGEHLQFLASFIQQNYLYQAAVFYDKKEISNPRYRSYILGLFKQNQYKVANHQIVFDLSKINKKAAPQNKKPSKVIEEKKIESESEAQQQKDTTQKQSLLSKLKKKGLQSTQLNFNDQKTKQLLIQLVQQYYNNQHKVLSSQQKSAIITQYPEIYNNQYYQKDIIVGDFICPIKYLSINHDIQSSKFCFFEIEKNIALLENVLFRQLFRLSLEQISAQLNSQYKQIIHFVNSFFKKLMAKYLNAQGDSPQILRVSELMIKISESLFSKQGIKKGKYHRLIHNHGRLIAQILSSIKNKSQVTKHLSLEQHTVLQHYNRIVKVYQAQNLYLFNIGIIECLTRKQLDHSQLRQFINIVINGSLKHTTIDHSSLVISVIKMIVFCGQLGSIGLDLKQIDSSFTSGIAKHVISDFFGLVKEKFKKIIARKILLYIKSLFQNTYIVENFKSFLVQTPKDNLSDLLSLYTQLYKILGIIQSEQKQILAFKEGIMDRITNIFPLDLRLTLFEPLLPNQHLYKYLGEQLSQHRVEKSQFSALSSLINIIPIQLSSEWVLFAKECLKRGNFPEQEQVANILNDRSLGNSSNYAQYICALAEYYPESLHPHLQASVQIVESHCEQPDDFTLAIISRLIRSLGDLLEPFLLRLIHVALNVESSYTENFILEITEHLVAPTLIKLVRTLVKQDVNHKNLSLFFIKTSEKGVGDSLNKTLLNFMSKTLVQYSTNEQNPEEIIILQAQIFLQIAIKMNESQLRKYIIDLVRWSENKAQTEDSLPFNLRKTSVAHIYSLLADTLQGLFTPLYGYIFDALMKDYQSITHSVCDIKDREKEQKKRSRQQAKQYNQSLIDLYLKSSLKSLSLLFQNDAEHQFLDSFKIQALGDPLSQLILLSKFERYSKLIEESLIPTIVSYHKSITDDYQMKTMNLKIMVLLKSKSPKVHRAIFELTEKLVDELKDRFLLLVSDVIPFLLEYAGSRQENIAKVVRKIISKIEELSGEQIQNYAK